MVNKTTVFVCACAALLLGGCDNRASPEFRKAAIEYCETHGGVDVIVASGCWSAVQCVDGRLKKMKDMEAFKEECKGW